MLSPHCGPPRRELAGQRTPGRGSEPVHIAVRGQHVVAAIGRGRDTGRPDPGRQASKPSQRRCVEGVYLAVGTQDPVPAGRGVDGEPSGRHPGT